MTTRLDQVDVFARQQLLKAMNKRKSKRLRKAPRWMYPIAGERTYLNALNRAIEIMRSVVERELVPILDSSLNQANASTPRTDAWSDDISTAMEKVRSGFAAALATVAGTAAAIAQKVNAFNSGQFTKVIQRVLGSPMRVPEPFSQDVISAFTKQNVALITKIGSDLSADIERRVFDAYRRQVPSKVLMKELLSTSLPEGVFSKVKTRAKLIARDQIGKLNGQLTQFRQQSIGVSRYRWRTARDERVRGRPGGLYADAVPSHWDREGKIYSWANAPDGGHPGEAINCRCYAEAVLEDIIGAAEDSGRPFPLS